jgi:hypothetical protein
MVAPGCTRSCPAARPSQADPRIVQNYQAPQQQGQYGSVAATASGPPPRVKLVLLGDSVRDHCLCVYQYKLKMHACRQAGTPALTLNRQSGPQLGPA